MPPNIEQPRRDGLVFLSPTEKQSAERAGKKYSVFIALVIGAFVCAAIIYDTLAAKTGVADLNELWKKQRVEAAAAVTAGASANGQNGASQQQEPAVVHQNWVFTTTCGGGAFTNQDDVEAPSKEAAIAFQCRRGCGKFRDGTEIQDRCLRECASGWRLGVNVGEVWANTSECRYSVAQRSE